MPHRKKDDKKDRKKFNHCAYCRNHGTIVLAKGHRGKCVYNNKKHLENCNVCKLNHRKTENTQRHREKNAEGKTEESKITSTTEEEYPSPEDNFGIDDLDIEYDDEVVSFDEEYVDEQDGTSESTDYQKSEKITNENSSYQANKPSTNTNSASYTIIIMAESYPFRILSKKYADDFMREIESVPGPSTATDPRIQYKFYEKGYIKVACLDEETRCTVLKLAKEFKLKFPRQKILAINEFDLLTIIRMSCILSDSNNFFSNGDEFLREVQEKNKLDAPNWVVEKEKKYTEPTLQFQKIYFTVDLLSASYISSRCFHLDIKEECVRVYIRRKSELEKMYATSLLKDQGV